MNRTASFLLALSLSMVPMFSARSAEDLVSQLEKCVSKDGFVGSLYSVVPGDMGLGYNLKFRAAGGNGYYARDYSARNEKSSLAWQDWQQTPRIMATREGRLKVELKSPTVILVLDVSISGKTLTGTVEYLTEPDDNKNEKRPEKFRLVCGTN